MDTATRLREAHAEAQSRFHEMFTAGVYGDPYHDLTRAYVAAERRVDDAIADAQWEVAKATMDALQAADHEMHDEPDPSCDDCQEKSAAMWSRMGGWSESEMREAYGR